MRNYIYAKLISTKSTDDNTRRQEFILNVLLVGIIALILLLTCIVFINYLVFSKHHEGISPLYMLTFIVPFSILLSLSRHGNIKTSSYILVTILIVLTTYSVSRWGVLLPQPILTYGLVVVMAGVLLGSKQAAYFTLLITIILISVVFLENAQHIHFDTSWLRENGGYNDVLSYSLTLGGILLISWLFNREIRRTLSSLRRTENDLILERNSLETKVEARTRELEKAQTEKMLEIHRFAEFGRVSATLMHELASPITSVMLNLERLGEFQQTKSLVQARKGLSQIESYVLNARLQLRKESQNTNFAVKPVINKLIGLLEPHARENNINVQLEKNDKSIRLFGDKVRFSQIIANIVMNSIDSYKDMPTVKKDFGVKIKLRLTKNFLSVTVSDRGQGIAEKDLPHIFNAFFTTKNISHGTGIGLTITKQIVEDDFGGTITATSSPVKGTKFYIHLPYSIRSNSQANHPIPKPPTQIL